MVRRADQDRLRMYISFVFSLVRLYISSGDESGGFLRFSFVFPTGGWGPDYDRQSRYWCQGKGYPTAVALGQRRSRCHGPSGRM